MVDVAVELVVVAPVVVVVESGAVGLGVDELEQLHRKASRITSHHLRRIGRRYPIRHRMKLGALPSEVLSLVDLGRNKKCAATTI